jgi:hypothetical protein
MSRVYKKMGLWVYKPDTKMKEIGQVGVTQLREDITYITCFRDCILATV